MEKSKDSDGDSEMECEESDIIKTEEVDGYRETLEEDVKPIIAVGSCLLPEGEIVVINAANNTLMKNLSGISSKSMKRNSVS